MSSFALVDTQQLNSGLSNLANTIRSKYFTTENIAFPAGFISKIEEIPTYDDVFLRRVSKIACRTIVNIRPYAFTGCLSLTFASFPACTTIGSGAFKATNLVSVSFPVCTTIGSAAFRQCTHLTAVYFPSCTTIWA